LSKERFAVSGKQKDELVALAQCRYRAEFTRSVKQGGRKCLSEIRTTLHCWLSRIYLCHLLLLVHGPVSC